MGEDDRGRNGGEDHEAATAFSEADAGARQTERGVPPTFRADACAETADANGTADAALAEVEPERPEVDGFSIVKAHGEDVSGG